MIPEMLLHQKSLFYGKSKVRIKEQGASIKIQYE